MKKIITFTLIIIGNFAFSQEICNNGIDDDADGLIDINDPDCDCSGFGGGSNVTSLIPNPSFEQTNCCPSSYSQLNCAASWAQATGATSDYFNCGYNFGAINNAGLNPPPDGTGYVGAIFSPGWQEYVGSCLNSPMLAGQSYTLQMSIASAPMDGWGNVCNGGNITYPPIDITIFGNQNCPTFPIGGTGCPPWPVLGTVNYTPQSTWSIITITFTPNVDINSIIIGSPCTLPGGYGGVCYPYFVFDNLILNTASSFAGTTITPNGLWCDNNLTLTGSTVATGGNWQWYLNGIALSGETDSTINVMPYGSGVFSAVYDDGSGCERVDYTVTIPPYPSANFTASSECFPNATNFTDNSTISGGVITNYDWDFGGGNTSNQQNPSYNFLNSGTYPVTLTVTSDSNCTNSYTTNITVFPEPVADFELTINGTTFSSTSSNIGGCLYDPITFNDLSSVNNPDNITQFSWDFGDGNTSNQQNPTHQYSVAGTYNVQLTVQSNNGCTNSITIPITIYPTPIADFSVSDVCAYTNASFINNSNVSSGAISNYVWNFGDGNTSNQQNPNHLYTDGNYTVSLLVISDSGCRDSTTAPITIFEVPQAEFSILDTCEYEDVLFTNQTILNTGTYTTDWTFGDGSTSTQTNPQHSYTYGNYVVDLLVISNNGCRDSVTYNAVVHPKPLANFQFTNECANEIVNFSDMSAVPTGNITNWSWDFGDGNNSNQQNSSNTYNTDGQYQVELIVSTNMGCLDTTTQTATIYPIPIPDIITSNNCLNIISSFTDNSVVNAPANITQYNWDFGDGNSSNQQNPTNLYTNVGSYTVTLSTTSSDGCVAQTNTNIEIYPLPVADFTSSSVCINTPPTIFTDASTIPTGSITQLNWSFSNGNTASGSIVTNTYDFATTTVQNNATLIATSNYGCIDSVTHPVTVFEKPQALFTSNETNVCNLGIINFLDGSNSNTSNINSWQWNFSNGTTSLTQNPTVNYTNDTDLPIFVDVELIVSNTYGCYDTLWVDDYITVIPTPKANFHPSPSLLSTLHPETVFINQSIYSDEYLWDFGDNFGTSIEENPTYIYQSVQETYVVELIAYNYNKFCSDTAYSTVIVKDVLIFYVPNIFTPDNDSFNQVWQPIFTAGVDPYDFHLTVFNRWGEIVWESYDYNAAWNGMYGGSLVQDGVYVWKIEFKETMSDKRHHYTGHVTILK